MSTIKSMKRFRSAQPSRANFKYAQITMQFNMVKIKVAGDLGCAIIQALYLLHLTVWNDPPPMNRMNELVSRTSIMSLGS